eukprot:COSAG01_NODE_14564_length_1437_cov_8.301943_1_plen_44_part_10
MLTHHTTPTSELSKAKHTEYERIQTLQMKLEVWCSSSQTHLVNP